MTPEQLARYSKWVPAYLKWKDTWDDGTGYYVPSNSKTYENEHGQKLIEFHGDREKQSNAKTKRYILEVTKDPEEFQGFPKDAYINLDPAYKGNRLITVEQHDKLAKSTPKQVDTVAQEGAEA